MKWDVAIISAICQLLEALAMSRHVIELCVLDLSGWVKLKEFWPRIHEQR